MLTARFHTVQWLSPTGLHKLAYREWGNADNPHVLLCVHGLTRSSADFEDLAQNLGQDLRVVAADMPGAVPPTGYPIPPSTPCPPT